jgi:hypothetical protein
MRLEALAVEPAEEIEEALRRAAELRAVVHIEDGERGGRHEEGGRRRS